MSSLCKVLYVRYLIDIPLTTDEQIEFWEQHMGLALEVNTLTRTRDHWDFIERYRCE